MFLFKYCKDLDIENLNYRIWSVLFLQTVTHIGQSLGAITRVYFSSHREYILSFCIILHQLRLWEKLSCAFSRQNIPLRAFNNWFSRGKKPNSKNNWNKQLFTIGWKNEVIDGLYFPTYTVKIDVIVLSLSEYNRPELLIALWFPFSEWYTPLVLL